jgi:tetratricopeptide (TPR) repeat protein
MNAVERQNPILKGLNIRSKWIIPLILIACIAAVYRGLPSYDFVDYDDSAYVTENRWVREGLSLKGLEWTFRTMHSSNWHPLTWLSHMADVELFGVDPCGHHLVNVILHGLNSILLFFLLFRMTDHFWRSALITALFAVHPLNVESVAWIAQRKTLLSTLFWILSLFAYLRYVEFPNPMRYMSVCLLFVLGLMAKPMLVTFPIILLLMDYWPLCRVQQEKCGRFIPKLRDRAEWSKLAVEKIPLVVLSAASGTVTYLAQQSGGAVRSFEAIPISDRLSNALVSYVRYIGKSFWPHDLVVLYPYPEGISGWQIVCSLLLLAGVTWLTVRRRERHPYLVVGWLWYLCALVPVIGLIQVGPQAMADRYAYVPSIGLFMASIYGLTLVFTRWRFSVAAATVSAIVLVAVLSMASWRQVKHWKDSVALFQHTVDKTVGNYIAHHNLALALIETGRTQEAIVHFKEALRIKAQFPKAHMNLGAVFAKQGRVSEAVQHYKEALHLDPESAGAHYNLGNLLVSQGKPDEAVPYYDRALSIAPDDPEIHNNLGIALFRQERVEEARKHYQKAVDLQPAFVSALLNLAKAHAFLNEYPSARLVFQRALKLRPDAVEIYYYVAVTYAKESRIVESVQWIEKAVENGFDNWEFLRKDMQLENIRHSPDYRRLVESRAITNESKTGSGKGR